MHIFFWLHLLLQIFFLTGSYLQNKLKINWYICIIRCKYKLVITGNKRWKQISKVFATLLLFGGINQANFKDLWLLRRFPIGLNTNAWCNFPNYICRKKMDKHLFASQFAVLCTVLSIKIVNIYIKVSVCNVHMWTSSRDALWRKGG